MGYIFRLAAHAMPFVEVRPIGLLGRDFIQLAPSTSARAPAAWAVVPVATASAIVVPVATRIVLVVVVDVVLLVMGPAPCLDAILDPLPVFVGVLDVLVNAPSVFMVPRDTPVPAVQGLHVCVLCHLVFPSPHPSWAGRWTPAWAGRRMHAWAERRMHLIRTTCGR